MKPSYLIFLLAVMPTMAQTQRLTFGVKGGVPSQTPLGQIGSRIPFVLGPTLNVRIFPRLSLETGILFHSMGQQSNTGLFLYPENAVTLSSGTERATAVEAPLLAKYHFLDDRRTWRPFITAGPSVRRTSFSSRYISSVLSGAPLGAIPQLLNSKTVKYNVDPVFGAGVNFKSGRFHFEPEVRYSYWGAGKNSAIRKNQVDYLFGLRF